jgi:hypothetical protein
MAASGAGRLHMFEGVITGAKYITILHKCTLPSAHRLFPSQFVFREDEALCHRSKLVIIWTQQLNIESIDWPAESPDLNPIKNLWHKLALEISKKHPTSKRELTEPLIAAWNRIVHDYLIKLHSMLTRV